MVKLSTSFYFKTLYLAVLLSGIP